MPQTTSCNGCGKNFSAPKYRRSHLSQTTDPRCQSERRAFLARRLPDYSPPASPQQSVSPPLPSSPLQGHTGSTEPSLEPPPHTPSREPIGSEDSDQSDDNPTSDSDSEQDLGELPDEDGDNDEDDFGELPNKDGDDDEQDSEEDDDDDEHGRSLSNEEATNLQGEIWEGVHMDVFRGQHAGSIHSNGIPTMKEFDNTLGGPPSNPYSPFSSQTDWELAKWAKLQGPGSTAFTELMGVTNVWSQFSIALSFSLTIKTVL
jgi:hypothetical protein